MKAPSFLFRFLALTAGILAAAGCVDHVSDGSDVNRYNVSYGAAYSGSGIYTGWGYGGNPYYGPGYGYGGGVIIVTPPPPSAPRPTPLPAQVR